CPSRFKLSHPFLRPVPEISIVISPIQDLWTCLSPLCRTARMERVGKCLFVSLCCVADRDQVCRWARGRGNRPHERIQPFDSLSFRLRMQPEANDPKENRRAVSL